MNREKLKNMGQQNLWERVCISHGKAPSKTEVSVKRRFAAQGKCMWS